MKSAQIKAFFSCSFRDSDRDVNDYFRSICLGLDVSCSNVDAGYNETPPNQALKMIVDADVVIAVVPQRNKIDGEDEYLMPEAISNEISFAFSHKKPLLMIKEEKVRVDGFVGGYGTYLEFRRQDLGSPDFLRKAVASIHNLKLGSLSDHELLVSQEIAEFIAESTTHLYELEREGDAFIWQHSSQRKLVFVQDYSRPLKYSRWNDLADSSVSSNESLLDFSFEIVKASRDFTHRVEFENHSSLGVTANVVITPAPVQGDWIDYFVSCRGRRLCPIYSEDIEVPNSLEINGRKFTAFDGIIPINRTKVIEIQFTFPREYRLDSRDAVFFVGSFARNIDYMVESEMERAHVEKKLIGGKLSIHAKITSPLLRHVYGVAWVAPNKPVSRDPKA